MEMVNVSELKAHLSKYARKVKLGETIIVCERNKPIGEFRPFSKVSKKLRPEPGLLAGQISLNDSFFDLDEEIEGDFLGTD